MSIQIVPMDISHVPACAAIIAQTSLWRDTYGVTLDSASRTLQTGLADSRQRLCVALDERKTLVGFAYYMGRGAFYFGSYLRLLAVHPERRGQRIGEQLVQYVEVAVRDETPHLFLMATEHNTAAHRFYERLGYQRVGAVADFVVTGVTENIFCKRLT